MWLKIDIYLSALYYDVTKRKKVTESVFIYNWNDQMSITDLKKTIPMRSMSNKKIKFKSWAGQLYLLLIGICAHPNNLF
jgi:hypothetical protein